MSTSRRRWLLVVCAVALLLAAGAVWQQANPLAVAGRPTVAEVVAASPGPPPTLTVRYTTNDGETVRASTTRIVGLPEPGTELPVLYDPSDPQQVAMAQYRPSSPVATVLVAASLVVASAAWFGGRRRPR
jgi:hypothetical protein